MISKETLTGFSLFKDVSPEVLEKIAAVSQEHLFNQGQIIFREGEKADKLHFLVTGSVALRVNIMSKPDSITVSFVSKPNECFGWSGLVSPHYYTATASCEEACKIMTVSGAQLLIVVESNPESGLIVMHRIANLVSERLRNSRQALIKTL